MSKKSFLCILGLFPSLIFIVCIPINLRKFKQVAEKYGTIATRGDHLVKTNFSPKRAVFVPTIKHYGFGNHLQGYALAYTLSRNINIPLVLPLPPKTDLELSQDFSDREYVLDHLILPKGIFVDQKQVESKKNIYLVTCKMAKDPFLIPQEVLNTTQYFKVHMFCSDFYFKEYEKELQNIKVSPEYLSHNYYNWKNLISSTEWPIAVHVRRGDIQENYWSAPVEYFQDALRRMREEVPYGLEKRIFVFSDDIKWAEKSFVGEGSISAELGWPIYFVSGSFGGLTNLEEFELMIKCKSIVISNSTFSWWAAYIMKNTGENKKIVIRPKFNKTKYNNEPVGLNGKKRREYGISYPETWISIDT